MELMLVLIGLFMVLAYVSNKDLSEKKENKEVFTFLFMGALYFILCGLGFLFPAAPLHTNYLMPFFVGCAAVTANSKGPTKVISRVAWVSILAYIIMGSFG